MRPNDQTHSNSSSLTGGTQLLEGGTKGFLGAFQLKRQEISGELAYIVWEARPWFAFATDTIVVRDGKILFQTFAAQTMSEESSTPSVSLSNK